MVGGDLVITDGSIRYALDLFFFSSIYLRSVEIWLRASCWKFLHLLVDLTFVWRSVDLLVSCSLRSLNAYSTFHKATSRRVPGSPLCTVSCFLLPWCSKWADVSKHALGLYQRSLMVVSLLSFLRNCDSVLFGVLAYQHSLALAPLAA